VKSLYKMCARHTLLPRSLHFEIPEDPTAVVLYHSGFADVSKREHRGQAIAVKVLRPRNGNGLQDMTNVGDWHVFAPFSILADRA